VRSPDGLRRPATRFMRRLCLAVAIAACLASPQLARADETVVACGFVANSVFQAVSAYGIQTQATCPGGGLLLATEVVNIKRGQNALWQATTPAGLIIVAATVPAGLLSSQYVNAGNSGDYGGDFYWSGGSSNITPGETSASFSGLASREFGFQLVCGKPTCNSPNFPDINVIALILTARDTSGPSLSSPSGLWQASGWIRGRWTLAFSGDSPSGMCSLTAQLANQPLPGSSSTANITVWHQCAAAGVSDPVDTASYPQGADTLQIAGTDAAGVPASLAETLEIDNQTPTVALSGPSDAPSTAGTQYVTATAAAGPSGVAGIACSVDSAPAQWYASSTAQVPVSGIGQHQVQCYAENNALDSSGVHGTSATQTFSMKIGQPTVSAVAFSSVVDRLRCRHHVEKVRIPARWVTVGVHGKPTRVRDRAHTEQITVTHCHAQTRRKRVTVVVMVRRHGKQVRVRRHKTIRVLLTPHVVQKTQRRVAHGRATTVEGWLGTTAAVALAGQTVQVLTAPDDGLGNYQVAATVTTAVDGSWSARLPAGPSRLIKADYQGAAATEAATSAPVTLTVPAEVKLISVSPRQIPWGGTVRLVGRLVGGYLPPGGALVRLRIGQGTAVTTYGVHEHVAGNGRFSTSYTFGAGEPSAHRTFWFQIASLPIGAYPYAPASSRRLSVRVGG
jgi:hypothetical protein